MTSLRCSACLHDASGAAARILVLLALTGGLALSLAHGAGSADGATVLAVLTGFDPQDTDHLILRDLRAPRAVAALLVGAALGVAGALMQGVTRNPLASPTLMGLNAGAGLGLACALVMIPDAPFVALIAAAFLGAGVGVGLSLGLGLAAGGASAPLRLALAGAAVSALLGALAGGVVIVAEIAQDVLFFTAGGVQGVGWGELRLPPRGSSPGWGSRLRQAPPCRCCRWVRMSPPGLARG